MYRYGKFFSLFFLLVSVYFTFIIQVTLVILYIRKVCGRSLIVHEGGRHISVDSMVILCHRKYFLFVLMRVKGSAGSLCDDDLPIYPVVVKLCHCDVENVFFRFGKMRPFRIRCN